MSGGRKPLSIEGEGENLMPADHVPRNVVQNYILPKLPVKSLLRFRCVSKSWLQLISDPQFTKDHLISWNNRQGFLISAVTRNRRHKTRRYYSPSVDDYHDIHFDYVYPPTQINAPRTTPLWFSIRGSCNGLVLTSSLIGSFGIRFFGLWNPATRSYLEFSMPKYPQQSLSFSSGLCYDSLTDDYKVVTMGSSSYYSQCMMVFSVKSNSWKMVGERPCSFILLLCCPASVNGILHWVAETRLGAGRVVVYFNPAEDTLKEVPVPLPEPLQNVKFGGYNLVVLRGSLCICTQEKEIDEFVVWELKEYRSWAKSITLPCCPYFDKFYQSCPKPLYFTKKDQLICKVPGVGVAAFDCRKKEWELFKDLRRRMSFSAITYVESLVLPIHGRMAARPESIRWKNTGV